MNHFVHMPQATVTNTLDEASLGYLGVAEFKTVMRSIASSVAIITTVHEGRLHGMTATAFSSVSADPPTVLIVLNKGTRTHPLVTASGVFAVNILTDQQGALSGRFSGKLDDQFSGVPHTLGCTGAPLLANATAHLECRLLQALDAGTHSVFIGRVVSGHASNQSPLLYHSGHYKSVSDILQA